MQNHSLPASLQGVNLECLRLRILLSRQGWFRAPNHISSAAAQLSFQHLQTRISGHNILPCALMTISGRQQIKLSFCWSSIYLYRSRHHGAQHTTSAPCAPTTHSLWKEATATEVWKQTPYLSLRHDVQILLIDGERHVSKDWAPVLENCHHFVLNSTMGRTICSDLEEAQTDYR